MSLFSFKFWALKREIKEAADELQREFPDNPSHEAKVRAMVECMGKKRPDPERVVFWTKVGKLLDERST
jgi:hypothetical protein